MKKISVKYVLVFFAFVLPLLNTYAERIDRILNYHSDIRIDSTGLIVVTENIRVDVTGESIKRGIVRSIPTSRKDINNTSKRIDIKVQSVLRDGKEETFSAKEQGEMIDIYIGRDFYELSPRIYNYTITYSSIGHIGFFDNYDELYWNVTGNNWDFPIDSVSATVYLPQGAKFIDNACYTGKVGSKESNCTYHAINDRTIEFYGSSSLTKNEGLTIATSFTPGIIPRPDKLHFFWENYGLFSIFILCILSFSAYIWRLFKKTNASSKPVVIPMFNPPGNISAAAIRYLSKKDTDSKTLTTGILSLAVKKSLSIKEEEKSYTLTPLGKNDTLTNEEVAVYDDLFADTSTPLKLNSKDQEQSEDAYYTLCYELGDKIKISDYYPSKTKKLIQTVLLSIAFVILWFVITYQTLNITSNSIFGTIIVAFFLIILVTVAYFNRKPVIVFCGICIFIIMMALIQIAQFREGGFQQYSIIFIWLIFAANFFVFKYLKPITKKGLEFDSELEGFEMYLKIAEENRLNFLTPPNHTPEQFEKILPYAVALDLEIEWADKFTKYLNQANYTPTWYIGKPITSYTLFTKNLSKSVTSTLDKNRSYTGSSNNSSSSSGRSSSGSSSWSSGSSGRGSSGGGGGGGGGRGW